MSSKNLIFSTLTDELGLAARWRRPSLSIITARDPVRFLDLAYRLSIIATELHLRIHHIHATPRHFDLPLRMRDASNRNGTLFICTGFSNGGGEANRNAYTALNMRREWLVDLGIKAVFCPTTAEARILPRAALDFWVFRHHAFEYPAVRIPSLQSVSPASAQNLKNWLDPSWLDSLAAHTSNNQVAFAIRWLAGQASNPSVSNIRRGTK